MTTVVTKSIGSNGRDYTTIALAWAAVPSDLVAADEQWILEVYNDTEFSARVGVLAAKTTDATRYITIRAAAGESFKDSPNKEAAWAFVKFLSDPTTQALWTSVNERDELGSDLVPDYMTSVKDGGF